MKTPAIAGNEAHVSLQRGMGMSTVPRKITDDPYGAAQLIKRLAAEQGLAYWRRYAFAFTLMGLSAAATAGTAYLLGQVINQAYVNRSISGIVTVSAIIIALFTLKGAATYGQAVVLSRISNAILADNQRKLFAKLMRENLSFYSERHSSEFLARLSAGAASITQVLALIGLLIVMVVQDPFMSLLSFVVAPPAFLFVRTLVKRIRHLAHDQFTGNTDIMETVQESLQGIRTVKAFTLEQTMQAHINKSIAEVEARANKMARVSNRSGPLMEMLGGIAIASALMYGGYRVIATTAAPGQFVSFITAFLLAYAPAKRLSRLNIDLNGLLIGARKLLEIIDSPASEPTDDNKPALQLTEGRVELRDVTFSDRADEPVLN